MCGNHYVGFVYSRGAYTTLMPSGCTSAQVTGISGSGELVVQAYDAWEGFLATPVRGRGR